MKTGIISMIMFGTIVTGCGGDDNAKAEAVRIGVDRVGECLSKAGWDTDPAHVEEGTSQAPADDTYRVSFQNLDDADAFVRLAVNVETGEALAYEGDDQVLLDGATCSLGEGPDSVDGPGTTRCVPGERCEINREQFGDEWPFTVAGGELACGLVDGRPDLGKVVLEVDGTWYAINGIAKEFAEEQGWHPLEEIWADNPATAQYGGKVNIEPMIALGLSICP